MRWFNLRFQIREYMHRIRRWMLEAPLTKARELTMARLTDVLVLCAACPRYVLRIRVDVDPAALDDLAGRVSEMHSVRRATVANTT